MHTDRFHKPLPASALDIEDKTRSNLFTWRGQFSPQLIETLLNFYCLDGSPVFDPFGGSGTVLYECALLDKEAHLTELNPAAWIFARTYELANSHETERKQAIDVVRNFFAENFPPQLLCDKNQPAAPEALALAVEEFHYVKRSAAEHLLFSATIVLLDIYTKPATPERIEQVSYQLGKKIIALPHCRSTIRAHLADARRTPFPDEHFGFVITSPPYINVFNYHQNYRASTELLGWDLLKVARSEIGSNRANRGNRFLTVAQYCFDMGAVLEELKRICRANANLILVVGRESAVLGVSWQNSVIVRRIAEESGLFKCKLVQERKFRNKFGATIYEDLLHLTPADNTNGWMKATAENIAQDVFRQAISKGDRKTLPLLEEAAEKIRDLGGTPVFNVSSIPTPFYSTPN